MDDKRLSEDIEHCYFCGVGILTCALSGPIPAAIAAILVVMMRAGWRAFVKKEV